MEFSLLSIDVGAQPTAGSATAVWVVPSYVERKLSKLWRASQEAALLQGLYFWLQVLAFTSCPNFHVLNYKLREEINPFLTKLLLVMVFITAIESNPREC